MKINFYGVKNAAALQTESGYVKMTKHGLAPASRHITLQAEITDKNSNDLEQLSPVLNVFKNRTNQNALNFTLDEYTTDHETFCVYGINGDVINSDETVDVGDVITYTLTVTNTGSTTFTDITVSDNSTGR